MLNAAGKRGSLSKKYWAVDFNKDSKTFQAERYDTESGELILLEGEAETACHARLIALQTKGGEGCDLRGMKGDPWFDTLYAFMVKIGEDKKAQQKKPKVQVSAAPLLGDDDEEV